MNAPESSAAPVVTYSASAGVGTIDFGRPPANAYDVVFHQQFGAAIDAADADPSARVVLIRSSVPRFFCAGADIKIFAANTPEENQRMVEAARAALAKIEASGKPFIACIEGHALGGGLEIAMACDLRLAASGTYKLGLPEIKLGLIPGNGGTQRLARIVGPSRAFELLISGDPIGPEEAERIGLVHRLLDADRFSEHLADYAARLAAGAPLAMAATKHALQEGPALPLEGALDLESSIVDNLYETHDAREGFLAAIEKRAAVFRGH